jgi:ArsR family transcriptional regulator
MRDFITFTHALADATRLRIVQLVADEAMCVCELADILEMPQSSVSSHIQVIRKAGLLDSERCEKWVYYRVAAEKKALLGQLLEQFEDSLARDATLKRDVKRAKARLAERLGSCCPGPKTLAYAVAAAEN